MAIRTPIAAENSILLRSICLVFLSYCYWTDKFWYMGENIKAKMCNATMDIGRVLAMQLIMLCLDKGLLKCRLDKESARSTRLRNK